MTPPPIDRLPGAASGALLCYAVSLLLLIAVALYLLVDERRRRR